MHPPVVCHLGTLEIQGYALFVALAFVTALRCSRAEMIRLGWHNQAGYRWLGVGGLHGAMVGAKFWAWSYSTMPMRCDRCRLACWIST